MHIHAIAKREPREELCLCGQLRRTARLISVVYDAALAQAGISITQFAVLSRIGHAEGLTHTALAALLGMDRTTLTRNLTPLERDGLVVSRAGEDRREKQLHLTAKGRKQAEVAKPHWRKAQKQLLDCLGASRWDRLHELLAYTDQAAVSGFTHRTSGKRRKS